MNKSYTLTALALGFCLTTAIPVQAADDAGGMRLKQTRVVMKDGAKTAFFELENHHDKPMVVTAWISEADGSNNRDFVVTPNIFKLNADRAGGAKIYRINPLPKDRESVFYLSVRTMPAVAPEKVGNEAHLITSLTQRIKVFYRPEGLKGDHKYAAERLIWTKEDGKLMAKNDTGLSVNVAGVANEKGETISVSQVVLPFEKVEVKTEDGASIKGSIKSFQYVNEWGGWVDQPINPKQK